MMLPLADLYSLLAPAWHLGIQHDLDCVCVIPAWPRNYSAGTTEHQAGEHVGIQPSLCACPFAIQAFEGIGKQR